MRITGTIRKWTTKGWGLANVYPDRRFFVHVSNAVSDEVGLALALNTKITFEEGEPRNPGDLPAALQIELAPITRRVLFTIAEMEEAPAVKLVKSDDGKEGAL